MTEFFERIRWLTPHLSGQEASDRLNDFESALFDDVPLALDFDESRQNQIVVFFYAANANRTKDGK